MLPVPLAAYTANSNDILGLWNNEEGDAIIEVFKCGEKYCGKVIWVNEPTYPADDEKSRAGQPRLDDNNPNTKLRNRPIVGLQIMDGFTFHGKNRWVGGTVYDPKNGKTYSGKMTLDSPDKLHLRGFMFFSLFGRTTTWTRFGHK